MESEEEVKSIIDNTKKQEPKRNNRNNDNEKNIFDFKYIIIFATIFFPVLLNKNDYNFYIGYGLISTYYIFYIIRLNYKNLKIIENEKKIYKIFYLCKILEYVFFIIQLLVIIIMQFDTIYLIWNQILSWIVLIVMLFSFFNHLLMMTLFYFLYKKE